MSIPTVVWIVVGSTTFVLLLVLMIGLVKQVSRLARAAAQFQREIRPALESIRDEGERARARSERMQQRAEALREDRRSPRRRR